MKGFSHRLPLAGYETYQGEAFAIDEGREKCVATMTATLMAVVGREGIQH